MNLNSKNTDLSIITEEEQNNAKNKIQQLVAYLVAQHLNNKGTYYESFGETQKGVGSIRISKKSPKYIATTITPYVVWLASIYLNKFYGEDQGIFKFTKKADEYIPGAYRLNFSILPVSQSRLPIFLLFLVVAFEDKFNSNEANKIVINRLSNLISEDQSIAEPAALA